MRDALAAVAGDDWAVALSGGLDSSVLMHAAAQARPRGVLRALHVNHGLHPKADAWERHSRALAESFGATFGVLRVSVAAGNLQANARRARYRAWRQALRPGETLLLAHHADDQAETVLWQMATGRFASGMPSVRRLGAGRLQRPFLQLRRRALAEYAARHGLGWVEDPANADRRFDRAYLRHEVLPLLEARFPNAVAALAAGAGRSPSAASAAPLPVRGLDAAGLRAWLGIGVPERLVAEVLRQASARRDANPIAKLPDGCEVRRYAGRLHRVDPAFALAPSATRSGDLPPVSTGKPQVLAHGTIGWRRGERGLPPHRTFAVRHRVGAERIVPAGRGVTKRLKTLLREARIPPWQRDAWPLLFAGDELVAVPGIAVAQSWAVAGGWQPLWTPAAAR